MSGLHTRTLLLFGLIMLANNGLEAQVGGRSTYDFLNLPNSARVASLGGKMLAVNDNDLNAAFLNPAFLCPGMDGQLSLNVAGYFADIKFGNVSYAHQLPWGMMAGGIQFINYGKFIEADETGTITGQFRASEYALHLAWSYAIDSSFRLGITLKPVFSFFERYSSLGLAADLGACYCHPDGTFSAALVVRNMGFQFTTYDGETREPLPFEIMAGLSQKLRYAPFRIYLLIQHLERWKLNYKLPDDPSQSSSLYLGDEKKSSWLENTADNALRHIIAGVEFTPMQNLYLRAGYNYQRRKELQVSSRVGTVGFSWGFGVKISKFQLSYGRATFHLAGASNHFSITTNLSDFGRK
jgi:hypothetical protein